MMAVQDDLSGQGRRRSRWALFPALALLILWQIARYLARRSTLPAK
jgi:uncharacterized membrane protein YhdT